MRSPAYRKERSPAAVRTGSFASLSVVVVSSGSALTQRAAHALKTASFDFTAQLIVVSQDDDPLFTSTLEKSGAEFVAAPAGSTRAEMCDLGMSCATGAIVAVRDDIAVGDARWLNAYRAVLPVREPVAPRSMPIESVVMDTLVSRRAEMADIVKPSSQRETEERATVIEMAAAV